MYKILIDLNNIHLNSQLQL